MTLGAQPPLGANTKPADANRRAWASSVAGISSTISTSKSWKRETRKHIFKCCCWWWLSIVIVFSIIHNEMPYVFHQQDDHVWVLSKNLSPILIAQPEELRSVLTKKRQQFFRMQNPSPFWLGPGVDQNLWLIGVLKSIVNNKGSWRNVFWLQGSTSTYMRW